MQFVKSAFKAIGSLFGGGTPKVSDTADKTLQANQAQANQGRAALYETGEGSAGQELDPNQVQQRKNLLGN